MSRLWRTRIIWPFSLIKILNYRNKLMNQWGRLDVLLLATRLSLPNLPLRISKAQERHLLNIAIDARKLCSRAPRLYWDEKAPIRPSSIDNCETLLRKTTVITWYMQQERIRSWCTTTSGVRVAMARKRPSRRAVYMNPLSVALLTHCLQELLASPATVLTHVETNHGVAVSAAKRAEASHQLTWTWQIQRWLPITRL